MLWPILSPPLEKIKTDQKGRFKFSGRGERIRTFDTLVPNQALYQTELRPESETYYNTIFIKSKYIFNGLLSFKKIKEIKPLFGVF